MATDASAQKHAKLSKKDIDLIQQDLKKADTLKELLAEYTHKAIGKRFGVSRRSIASLKNGYCYKAYFKRNDEI